MTPWEIGDAVRAFTEALYEPADIVEVRRLPSRQSTWHRSDSIPVAALAQENRRGQNVYVGGNPRRVRGSGVKAAACTEAKPCGRCQKCVALARCLFVDFDGIGLDEVRYRLREADLPAPTVLIASGGGVHAYWRLDNPLTDLSLWSGHQRALIEAVNSDPAVHDPPRIMRLPGFLNHKYRPPRECCIIECDAERTYALDEFPKPKEAVNRTVTSTAVETYRASDQIEMPCRRTLEYIARGADIGGRRTGLFIAACDLAGCNWLKEQAEAVLMPRAMVLRQADEDPNEWRTRCQEQIDNAYGRPRLPARVAARISGGDRTDDHTHRPRDNGSFTVTLPTGTKCTFTRRPVKRVER